MRIAVTATSPRPDAEMDPRFGRAGCFLVHDTETGDWTPVDNSQNRDAAHGAGIAAAQAIVRAGATVLLTGACGPKAMDVFNTAGVRVIEGEEGTAESAVQRFLSR
ncbi:MAG: dinitrogenase iron-molybdenum cofactor biosynthesis protein [Armatimonadetes bacterium]|nr:dinitrogenase iron-molybdenum cofactor biosynthesis protein [Armatimonadota bacterium]